MGRSFKVKHLNECQLIAGVLEARHWFGDLRLELSPLRAFEFYIVYNLYHRDLKMWHLLPVRETWAGTTDCPVWCGRSCFPKWTELHCAKEIPEEYKKPLVLFHSPTFLIKSLRYRKREKKQAPQNECGSRNLFVALQLFHSSPQIESLVKANVCGSRGLRVLKNTHCSDIIWFHRKMSLSTCLQLKNVGHKVYTHSKLHNVSN